MVMEMTASLYKQTEIWSAVVGVISQKIHVHTNKRNCWHVYYRTYPELFDAVPCCFRLRRGRVIYGLDFFVCLHTWINILKPEQNWRYFAEMNTLSNIFHRVKIVVLVFQLCLILLLKVQLTKILHWFGKWQLSCHLYIVSCELGAV